MTILIMIKIKFIMGIHLVRFWNVNKVYELQPLRGIISAVGTVQEEANGELVADLHDMRVGLAF